MTLKQTSKGKGQSERMCSAHPESTAETCYNRAGGGYVSLQAVQRQLGRKTCQHLILKVPLPQAAREGLPLKQD